MDRPTCLQSSLFRLPVSRVRVSSTQYSCFQSPVFVLPAHSIRVPSCPQYTGFGFPVHRIRLFQSPEFVFPVHRIRFKQSPGLVFPVSSPQGSLFFHTSGFVFPNMRICSSSTQDTFFSNHSATFAPETYLGKVTASTFVVPSHQSEDLSIIVQSASGLACLPPRLCSRAIEEAVSKQASTHARRHVNE